MWQYKDFLAGEPDDNDMPRPNPWLERKARLLVVAALRRLWDRIPDRRSREALEIAEAAAEDRNQTMFAHAERMARQAWQDTQVPNADGHCEHTWGSMIAYSVLRAVHHDQLVLEDFFYIGYEWDNTLDEIPTPQGGKNSTVQALHLALFRDIFPNPFRPVAFAPAWLTPTVTALAAAIYADRAWDRMPVLAVALEEAGCGDARVLGHCRDYPVHARGCWVVDAILGKS
jgi:hypothetical protein